jgi:glucose/arabinose dehydrogenase
VIRRTTLWLLAGLAFAPAAHGATLEQVGSFSSPVSIAGAPGDEHRVYVVEQGGVIRELLDGVEQATPYLDIHTQVLSGGERGLLSMAIDPADPTHVFVYYTASPNGDIHVDRFVAPTPDGVVGSGTTILSIPHSDPSHNGGQLQFAPDGTLYASTGDGGGSGDHYHNAQNLTDSDADAESDPRLGKLLRINPDGSAPADNPFQSPDYPAPAHYVWALGLRNPWRFSFDRLTGDLTIGDVGQGAWEEVDFAPAPAAGRAVNYGWNQFEGLHDYSDPSDTPGPNCCTQPVLEHSHSSGWYAIIGGYVVRDPAVPELAGRYLYGDNVKGDLYAATLGTDGASGDGSTGLHVSALTGFGEDGVGRLYAASLGGPVYRLVGAPVPPASGPGGDSPGPGPAGGSPGPAPGGGSPPPGATTDTTAPRITLQAARRQHVLRTGRFIAELSCDEQCALRVGAKRSKSHSVTAAAAARIRFVLRPTRRALRLWGGAVRRHHPVVIRIRVRATDAAGNVSTDSARVRVLN